MWCNYIGLGKEDVVVKRMDKLGRYSLFLFLVGDFNGLRSGDA